jgi:hypothetical protein
MRFVTADEQIHLTAWLAGPSRPDHTVASMRRPQTCANDLSVLSRGVGVTALPAAVWNTVADCVYLGARRIAARQASFRHAIQCRRHQTPNLLADRSACQAGSTVKSKFHHHRRILRCYSEWSPSTPTPYPVGVAHWVADELITGSA